jgi:non-canonical purine NTP pyrophosphatase (RdgB/HAM1 family)
MVLASRNAGKAREFQALLDIAGLELRALSGFVPPEFEIDETGATFEENAWIKASTVCRVTGLAALADDSGLEVDALGGRPGVHSARFAGPGASDDANNRLLLSSLAGLETPRRSARFRAVLVVAAWAGGRVVQVARSEGVLEGAITMDPRGSGGFGYDCLFEPTLAPGRTTAEMSLAEKNALSHRGQAARKLKPALVAWCRGL